jgi:hypothetical protein
VSFSSPELIFLNSKDSATEGSFTIFHVLGNKMPQWALAVLSKYSANQPDQGSSLFLTKLARMGEARMKRAWSWLWRFLRGLAVSI